MGNKRPDLLLFQEKSIVTVWRPQDMKFIAAGSQVNKLLLQAERE